MRAIVFHQYGSPANLELEEVEKPSPGNKEVLVKVYASSLNAADLHLLSGTPFLVRLMVGGISKPKVKILGADVAGRIEAIGAEVKKFRPGDEVFGDLSGCGFGALAEYVAVPENVLALKPVGKSFEEAAAVPLAAVTALQGLRDKGGIKAGQKVLVNGASGGVGSFAVQMAKVFGAEVTGVCSTEKLEMVRKLGADRVIDYKKEDFTRNGLQYDLILDTAAYHALADIKRALSPKGRYVLIGGPVGRIFQVMFLGPWISMGGSRKMSILMAKANSTDLERIKGLIDEGRVVPVVDRRFPLQAAAEAFRYFEEGHVRGKVVITV